MGYRNEARYVQTEALQLKILPLPETGKPADMLKAGVVEPLRVKSQAISSAAEAAVMILRIDDIIASSKTAAPEGGGMQPGMGGMPPGMGDY